ncbi:MAG: NAD(P)H-hydrate dehydratase [Herminiimonas sp.]|nr:NAD(P)H-hydrate dehydratase [Herminiimonas sp.]
MPSQDGDKEQRGRILIIGGSREIPGAILLAATAALRAGAGKLAIATGASVAQLVAIAIPEARVIGLPESDDGGFLEHAAATVAPLMKSSDAVLIGPGMQDEASAGAFIMGLLASPELQNLASPPRLLLDACAMCVAGESGTGSDGRGFLGKFNADALFTPHAGEVAHLTGMDKDEVLQHPQLIALEAARRWGAAVALKGATTCIAMPDGRLWEHCGGNVGLAISGSGDALSGIIAGLMARGAPTEQAAAWGVALHARAGDQLARRMGPLGFLAREIADEVPRLMVRLADGEELDELGGNPLRRD